MKNAALVFALLLLATPGYAAAQERAHRFEAATAISSTPAVPSFFNFTRSRISIAKWSTLAVSTALGAYGFIANADAEDGYAELEQLCAADTVRCAERLPGGAFADAGLEARYQEVVSLDRRARVALIASQIGIATSVVLFVLDIHEGDAPPNIPYEPELSVRADGAYQLTGRIAF